MIYLRDNLELVLFSSGFEGEKYTTDDEEG